MSSGNFDKRFCQSALDGLKSFRPTELTVRFLKRHNLTVDKTLALMWSRIEEWLNQDPSGSRCRELWKYVDDLRMWGRQRVFLFELEEGYTKKLSEPAYVKKIVPDLYEKAAYIWEADDPFVAEVKHEEDSSTHAPILVFKLIENRKFKLVVEGEEKPFDERSTNFFIINLQKGYAELRLQELPTGAVRNIGEERDLFTREIGKYLDLSQLKPIDLVPVMDVMLSARKRIYAITSSRLKFTPSHLGTDARELVDFLKRLLKRSEPAELTAYWECDQDVLGRRRLHFSLSGASDCVAFGGIADPARVSEIVDKLVDISRKLEPPDPKPSGGVFENGIVDKALKNLVNEPSAQALVLSAGAIAASILWIPLDWFLGWFRDYASNALERRLGFPTVVITILAEVAWIIFYYGWRRVLRGFRVLAALPTREFWKVLNEARKHRKE